ncbi:MAG: BREX-2 system adenine-specific DNA-methyltransferase PglX [Acidimicrobiia bacterium]|nr:BREX-2 system adenine-specific DNA-methyltransferase PglX [Acidimicrobiia bacterium]
MELHHQRPIRPDVSTKVPTRPLLDNARARAEGLRSQMVAAQEELDWHSYFLYGVTAEDLSLPPDGTPPIANGERSFAIALARTGLEDGGDREWFSRHGSTPITEIPSRWPDEYRALVEKRLALIESDRFVNLLERPEYKRRWNWESWEKLEAEALRSWLLDRLEAPELWGRPQLRSVAQLADLLRADADFRQVAELYRCSPEVDLTALVGELVADQAVPYLAAWRYTATGLRTRAVWEATWDLQRREDAGEDVGTIPVPPKYGSGDFASKAIWSLRGKLDVPKERFVSYPGAGRETDPTLLVGWAGWDHLHQASALAAWYQERRNLDGWGADKLTPVLAGLAELVPWLLQWYDEPDPSIGMGMGTFFADFVATECRDLGLTPEASRLWAVPAPSRGRKRKTV